MIGKIIKKLFYSPYKYVKKHVNIVIDDTTILLEECSFRFDGIQKNNHIQIGKNSMIGNAFIFETDEGKIEVGDNTFINTGTNLICREHIKIGNYVTIAWGCTLYDHNSHSLNYKDRQQDIHTQIEDYKNNKYFTYSKNWDVVKSSPIIIQDNVWIGFNCIILNGVTIGEGAIIGAGSVIRHDIPPWTVVAGNPQQIIKRLQNE